MDSSHPRSVLTACFPSFGDPIARPPTPQRTPSALFSSPLLQTPKQTTNSSHFDETSGWTPRFAEQYSVFNSTPGNLRGDSSPSRSGAFTNLDFAPPSPAAPLTGKKRPLSAETLVFEVAAHANHCAADSASLALVDPARRPPSSTEQLTPGHKDAGADPNATPKTSQPRSPPLPLQQPARRSAKKPRRASVSGPTVKSPVPAQNPTQTATPPPSSRGGRKLAPKPQMDSMQNQGFAQPNFSSAPQPSPQVNTAFLTHTASPDDVYGYPVGPVTAPPITGPRPFWGMDVDTSCMDSTGMAIDVDLSSAGADIFQTSLTQTHSHGQVSSMDWVSADFQQQNMVALQDQQYHRQQQQQPRPQPPQSVPQSAQQNATPRRERPLAPKTTNMTTPNNMAQHSPSQSFYGFSQMMENPFSASPGGVNPGLLFSQPTSSAPTDSSAMTISMSTPMDTASQHPTSSTAATMAQSTVSLTVDSNALGAPMSAGNSAPPSGSQDSSRSQPRKQLDLAPAISPTKRPDDRPNLSRSFSESARGGMRTLGGGRNSLPALAPARPATVQPPNLPPPPPATNQGKSRPQTQGGRAGGRISPSKTLHDRRLSNLTSIPENAANTLARSRSSRKTSVKFVIDENGRARAETVVDEDDEPEPEPMSSSQYSTDRHSGGGVTSLPAPTPDSDEECSSSSDDEPIIIPSRNTSFNLPEPPRLSDSGNSRPPTASSIVSQNRTRYRSFSDRPSTSSFRRDEADSMDMDPPQLSSQPQRPSTGGSLGDAAAELRKVMQAGNPRRSSSGQQTSLPGSGGSSGHRQRFTPGQRSSSSTISEASLPGASPTQQSQVRCVCNRPETGEGAFLIKW